MNDSDVVKKGKFGRPKYPSHCPSVIAQLIVQECCIVIQDFIDHRIPASEYPNLLKQHFGIEGIKG